MAQVKSHETCRACWNAKKHAIRHAVMEGPAYFNSDRIRWTMCQGHAAIASVCAKAYEENNGANLFPQEDRAPVELSGRGFGKWVVISESDTIYPFKHTKRASWGVALVRVAQVREVGAPTSLDNPREYRTRKIAVLAHNMFLNEHVLDFTPGAIRDVAIAIALDWGMDTCVYGRAHPPKSVDREYQGRQSSPKCE